MGAHGPRALRVDRRAGARRRVKDRGDAFDPDLVAGLERSSLIFFSGGNPAFLASTVVGSPLADALHDALDRGAALAGCSAGACLFGEFGPESVTGRIHVEGWATGLRLLDGTWVVPHRDALDGATRDYFLRHIPLDGVALCIDERTMLIRLDDTWRVFGEGGVGARVLGRFERWTAGATIALEALLPASSPIDLAADV